LRKLQRGVGLNGGHGRRQPRNLKPLHTRFMAEVANGAEHAAAEEFARGNYSFQALHGRQYFFREALQLCLFIEDRVQQDVVQASRFQQPDLVCDLLW